MIYNYSPTGSINMALLENLKPDQVYLVKVSASNKMGDGPFSHVVELKVRSHLSSDPHGSTHSTGYLIAYVLDFAVWNCRFFFTLNLPSLSFADGFYHLDQNSMTGITIGVCIALICIIICGFIIVCRGKNRYSESLIVATAVFFVLIEFVCTDY